MNCSYKKTYHEQRGKSSLIKNVGRPPTNGHVVPISNGGYRNPNIGFMTKCGVKGSWGQNSVFIITNEGDCKRWSPMILKCTPILGVALVRESQMSKALVEKLSKHQIGPLGYNWKGLEV